MSNLVCLARPEGLPVDLATVWAHLGAIPADEGESPSSEAPADAALIEEHVRAAVDRLDGPTGLLNRALIVQTWEARFPKFSTALRVPLARCTEILGIDYIAADGSPKSLTADQWSVTGLNTDTTRVRPAAGKCWPSTQLHNEEAVVVRFVSGFGEGPDDIPASIRLAILEMVASSYENREAIITGLSAAPLPAGAARAVVDWQVWMVA